MTLAHAESVWSCLYRCLYLFLSHRSWFVCRRLWPTFSIACHHTPSTLRGGYAVVLMHPWFNGLIVWIMYSVVDPMYKAIVVAGYLCISVRWIIYYIDILGLCLLLPWRFFRSAVWQILQLLHASMMLLHDHSLFLF